MDDFQAALDAAQQQMYHPAPPQPQLHQLVPPQLQQPMPPQLYQPMPPQPQLYQPVPLPSVPAAVSLAAEGVGSTVSLVAYGDSDSDS